MRLGLVHDLITGVRWRLLYEVIPLPSVQGRPSQGRSAPRQVSPYLPWDQRSYSLNQRGRTE